MSNLGSRLWILCQETPDGHYTDWAENVFALKAEAEKFYLQNEETSFLRVDIVDGRLVCERVEAWRIMGGEDDEEEGSVCPPPVPPSEEGAYKAPKESVAEAVAGGPELQKALDSILKSTLGERRNFAVGFNLFDN